MRRSFPRTAPWLALVLCAGMSLRAYLSRYESYSRIIADRYTDQGHLLLQRGRTAEAAGRFRLAIARSDHRAYPHFVLGQLLWLKGEKDGAVHEFRQALRIHPEHSRAHHQLGVALAALGRGVEAAEHCRKAHLLDPAVFTRPDCSAP